MKLKEMKIEERIKFFILKCRRFFHWLTKGTATKISFVLLLFSACVSLTILIPNCLDRTPVFSYFICKYDLPITYELTGNIKIIGNREYLIDQNITIFIGGYSTTADVNGDFKLTFSSPKTEKLFATIIYKDATGQTIEASQMIVLRSKEHLISRRFIVYA